MVRGDAEMALKKLQVYPLSQIPRRVGCGLLLALNGHQRDVTGCLLMGEEQTWAKAEPSNTNAGLAFKRVATLRTIQPPIDHRNPVNKRR
jgi:hypothetical protein